MKDIINIDADDDDHQTNKQFINGRIDNFLIDLSSKDSAQNTTENHTHKQGQIDGGDTADQIADQTGTLRKQNNI